jgi:hypothetical protein
MATLARLFGKPSKTGRKAGGKADRKNVSRSSSPAAAAALQLEADHARSKEIEKRLWEDKKKADKEIKIILLGQFALSDISLNSGF